MEPTQFFTDSPATSVVEPTTLQAEGSLSGHQGAFHRPTPGMLTMSDGTIRFTEKEGGTQVFSANVLRLEKVIIGINQMSFRLEGKNYMVLFKGYGASMGGLLLGGIIGLLITKRATDKMGLENWVTALTQQGVVVRDMTFRKSSKFGMYFALVIIILIILYVIV